MDLDKMREKRQTDAVLIWRVIDSGEDASPGGIEGRIGWAKPIIFNQKKTARGVEDGNRGQPEIAGYPA